MGQPQTEVVTLALIMVDEGVTPYRAAMTTGIALSTMYRAIERRKKERQQLAANNSDGASRKGKEK